MDSKRTCSDFWKNRKNMQSLISQGLAGQINPIFIGYLNCSLFSQIKLRSYSSELDYFIYTLNKKYATALELQAPIVIYVKRQITVNM